MNTFAGGGLTSALCCAGRTYVGAEDGSLSRITVKDASHDRSVRADATNVTDESDRSTSAALPLTHALWTFRVCAHAIMSVCGVEIQDKSTLLLVGSAGGELVVLREELELRRYQLESAVQHICFDQNGEFIVGDMLGNLYGVTQYEILWKKRLPCISIPDEVGPEFFYPSLSQPTVTAIMPAKLLDVEKTLSNYVLVATGQKHLLVTYRGKNYCSIPTHTPIATLMRCPNDDEDTILAAGEEGVTYRLVSYWDIESKDLTIRRFALKRWTQVSFPIARLLPVEKSVSNSEAKQSDFAWICLGVDGEVALFRGQEHVKEWDLASLSSPRSVESNLPLDITLLKHGDADIQQQSAVIVLFKKLHIFSIEPTGQI